MRGELAQPLGDAQWCGQLLEPHLALELLAVGAGRGRYGRLRWRRVRRSGDSISCVMSAPDMPSIMQWCSLDTVANRPPLSPSTTHVSHSGRARSSGCEAMRPVSAFSCAAPPGRGSAVAHVVVDVEVRIVDPHRRQRFVGQIDVAESEQPGAAPAGAPQQLLAVARHLFEQALGVVADGGEIDAPATAGERTGLEDRHPDHAHVALACLLDQEREIGGCESLEMAVAHGCIPVVFVAAVSPGRRRLQDAPCRRHPSQVGGAAVAPRGVRSSGRHRVWMSSRPRLAYALPRI